MYLLHIAISLCIFFFGTIKTDNEFTITGFIEGMEDTEVELVIMNQSGGTVLANSFVENGKFTMRGKINHPVYAFLRFADYDKYINLWVEASQIQVTSNVLNVGENARELQATIIGSREQLLMQQYLDFIQDNYKEVSGLVQQKRISEDPDEQDRLEEKITEARSKARERSSEFILDFVRQNSDAVVSVYMMRTEINDVYNDIWELDEILNSFSERLKKTDYFIEIRERLDLLIKIQPGQPAPEFTLTTWQGSAISLSDFRGKVVLLDFWASWCAPCIAAMPDLKKLYEKYRLEGFEIVGISTDTDTDAWLRAINQHELTWTNVIDERPDGILKSIVGTDYSISFLPTLFLIDKEGKIAAKNVAKDEIEQLLNELL